MRDGEQDRHISRQGRVVAVVIAATMILWVGAQWIGGRLGLGARYVFLFDLAAMAAFAWSLIVTWRIWRKRRD